MSYIKDGTEVEVVHLGHGVVVREDLWGRITDSFTEVWPWTYGPGAPNSKDKRTFSHRQSYDLLISAVWPAHTDMRYFALEGFPPRSDFHKVRVQACMRKHLN